MQPHRNLRLRVGQKQREPARLSLRPADVAEHPEVELGPAMRSWRKRRCLARTQRQDGAVSLSVNGDGLSVAHTSSSGKLDLSALELERIPPETYTALLGIPPEDLSNPPDAPSSTPSSKDVKGMTASFSTQLAVAEKSSSREEIFGKGKRKEEWSEPEAELVAFNVERNRIEVIEREIGAFGGLKTVNVSA